MNPIMKAVIPTAKTMVTTKPEVVKESSLSMQTLSPDAVMQRTPSAQVTLGLVVGVHPSVTPVDFPDSKEHVLVETYLVVEQTSDVLVLLDPLDVVTAEVDVADVVVAELDATVA